MFVVCQSGRRSGKATFIKENYYMPDNAEGTIEEVNYDGKFCAHFVPVIRKMREPTAAYHHLLPTMNECLSELKKAIDSWKPFVDLDNVKAEI